MMILVKTDIILYILSYLLAYSNWYQLVLLLKVSPVFDCSIAMQRQI